MVQRAVCSHFGVIFFVSTFIAAAASPSSAQDVATFYKGKSIRLVIANGVGGGNDAYSRLLARYIVNHIPGQPSIIVENMPGERRGVGRSATQARLYLIKKRV